MTALPRPRLLAVLLMAAALVGGAVSWAVTPRRSPPRRGAGGPRRARAGPGDRAGGRPRRCGSPGTSRWP